MAQTLQNWVFKEKHVNDNHLVSDGFASAESIVLVAGPPTVGSNFNATGLNTIGVVESAAISQNKQIQQIYEIGSKLPFNIPGRTTVNVALSRIMFDGESLMAAIAESNTNANDYGTGNDSPGFAVDGSGQQGGTNDKQGNFYLNLASSYFNQPIGLGMIFHDNEDQPLAMIYLEECLIRSQQLSIGAGQTIVMENVNIVAANIQPINYGGNRVQ